MNFSGNLINLDWTSEHTLEAKKPFSLNRAGSTSLSTRSNTSGEQSPERYTSDSFSDKESNVESVAYKRTQSSPSNYEGDLSDSNFEIDVCPKRKKFNTVEERRLFIEEYKRKYKTELCKNWELRGVCKFGDKCCFAHGKHELKNKTLIHVKYKTKPCKQYHQTGYCPYGQRCQYLHKEAIQPNIFFSPCQMQNREGSYTYEELHEINKLCGTDIDLNTVLAKLPIRPRLGVFGKIATAQPEKIAV